MGYSLKEKPKFSPIEEIRLIDCGGCPLIEFRPFLVPRELMRSRKLAVRKQQKRDRISLFKENRVRWQEARSTNG